MARMHVDLVRNSQPALTPPELPAFFKMEFLNGGFQYRGRRLAVVELEDSVQVVSCPPGTKDITDLAMSNPRRPIGANAYQRSYGELFTTFDLYSIGVPSEKVELAAVKYYHAILKE